MNAESLFEELTKICERMAIEVRVDKCPGDGGMFSFRGRKVMVINPRLSKTEAIWLIANELSRIDIEEIFLKPAIRELLDKAKSERIRPPEEFGV
ncbi:MAG: hypothetical protein ACYS8W_07635 [Planctomycetota bacterium]|jgi:hypothetical protein